MSKQAVKVTPIEIIDYWNTKVDEIDIGIDWADSIIDKSEKVKGCGSDRNFLCVNGLLKKQNLVLDNGTPDWTRIKELKISSKNLRFRCWACASVEKSIERCHIKGRQFGGSDEVSNLVLLCYECHKKSPDMKNDTQAIWLWIKAMKKPFYNAALSYEALDAFKNIYGYEFTSEESPIIKSLNNSKHTKRKINKFIKELKETIKEECGIHFNQLSSSSIAVAMKMVIDKEIENEKEKDDLGRTVT